MHSRVRPGLALSDLELRRTGKRQNQKKIYNFKDFCNVKIDASVWNMAEHDKVYMLIQKGTDGRGYYLTSRVTRV